MAAVVDIETIEAVDLRAGMTVRVPADFKWPAGPWLTVERALKYAQVMKVKFTNDEWHHPRHDDPYEVKP